MGWSLAAANRENGKELKLAAAPMAEVFFINDRRDDFITY
jgi:hypothetical protein